MRTAPFRKYVLAIAGLLTLLAWRPLQAAPPPASAPLSEADEDRLLQSSIARAKEQLALGNPAAALSSLMQAYDRVPTPALLWPIAELQLRLGHAREGRAALDKYVAQVPPSKMPKGQQLADVERLRDEFAKQSGRIVLAPLAPGTSLRVDDEDLDAAAQAKPIVLDPGRHRLVAQRDGRTQSREVVMNAGQELHLDLRAGESALRDFDPRSGQRRMRPVRTAAIAMGAIGVAGIIAGSVLWGLDGLQSCPQAPLCSTALDSKTTGVGLFAAGIGLGSAALVFGLIDSRSGRTD